MALRTRQPGRHHRPDRRLRRRRRPGLRRLALAGRPHPARLEHRADTQHRGRHFRRHRLPARRTRLVPQVVHPAGHRQGPPRLGRVRRRLHGLLRLLQRHARRQPPLRLHRIRLRPHRSAAHRRPHRQCDRGRGAQQAPQQPLVLRQRHLPQRPPRHHRPGARRPPRHLRHHARPRRHRQPGARTRLRHRPRPDRRRQRIGRRRLRHRGQHRPGPRQPPSGAGDFTAPAAGRHRRPGHHRRTAGRPARAVVARHPQNRYTLETEVQVHGRTVDTYTTPSACGTSPSTRTTGCSSTASTPRSRASTSTTTRARSAPRSTTTRCCAR